ncbi:hypothetical protein PR048_019886 [Dryococelus australis]|uniref:Uncharacterized protein n=1 Tax=Dryococelus australis TaxID=614101 RepID=A0ABQ9H4U0_9NEOP|nr:hypothetical protein PR048_019886 [Dryococelus australis]
MGRTFRHWVPGVEEGVAESQRVGWAPPLLLLGERWGRHFVTVLNCVLGCYSRRNFLLKRESFFSSLPLCYAPHTSSLGPSSVENKKQVLNCPREATLSGRRDANIVQTPCDLNGLCPLSVVLVFASSSLAPLPINGQLYLDTSSSTMKQQYLEHSSREVFDLEARRMTTGQSMDMSTRKIQAYLLGPSSVGKRSSLGTCKILVIIWHLAELHCIVYTRVGVVSPQWLLHVYEATPFLTELHVIGVRRWEVTTVAERLDYSPPTRANRVQSPAGSLPDFRKWESCRTIPLVGGFTRRSSVLPCPCTPALLHSHLTSRSSALKSSLPQSSVGHCECVHAMGSTGLKTVHDNAPRGVVIRTFASNYGDSGSIPDGVTDKLSHVGERFQWLLILEVHPFPPPHLTMLRQMDRCTRQKPEARRQTGAHRSK